MTTSVVKRSQIFGCIERLDDLVWRLENAKRLVEECPKKTSTPEEVSAYLLWRDLSMESGSKYAGFPAHLDKPYDCLLRDIAELKSEARQVIDHVYTFYDESVDVADAHMFLQAVKALRVLL